MGRIHGRLRSVDPPTWCSPPLGRRGYWGGGGTGQSDQELLRQWGAQLGPGEVLRDEATQLTSGKVVGLTVRRCGGDRGDGGLVEIRSPGPAPRDADSPGSESEVLRQAGSRGGAGPGTQGPPTHAGNRRERKRPQNPLQRCEREVISTTLQACNGKKVHASAHLGISRTTLYRRVRELGIPSG